MIDRSLLSIRATEGLEDFWVFAQHFCGTEVREEPHRLMTSVMQLADEDEATPWVMLVVPRGTYKSTLGRAWLPWLFLRRYYRSGDVYHRSLIATNTLSLARSHLSHLKDFLRGGGYRGRLNDAYGELWQEAGYRKRGSGAQDSITFAPRLNAPAGPVSEPSIFIGSTHRISTGFHADTVLADDLNNHENVQTPQQRQKVHDYWNLLFPIVGPAESDGRRTRMLFTCTPWHDDDVRGRILREDAMEKERNPKHVSPWLVVHHGILNDDGTSFFPDKYPLPVIKQLERNLPAALYSANYLCDPVGKEGFVKEDWIHFEDPDSWPPFVRGRITVDPNIHAEAKDAGCWAAFIVKAWDRFGKCYVLEATGSRSWSPRRFINEFFDLAERFPDFQFWVEEAHMAHLEHAIRLEEAAREADNKLRRRIVINWVPVEKHTSKYERFEKLEPRFRNRQMVLSERIAPEIRTEIKTELVRGRKAAFKDFLDALAIGEVVIRIRKDGESEMHVPAIGKLPAPRALTYNDAFGEVLP